MGIGGQFSFRSGRSRELALPSEFDSNMRFEA